MTMPPVAVHTIFEASAYFIERRLALPALTERENDVWIAVAAIAGGLGIVTILAVALLLVAACFSLFAFH